MLPFMSDLLKAPPPFQSSSTSEISISSCIKHQGFFHTRRRSKMAMILSASVTRFADELADFAKKEKCEVLGAGDEIKKLQKLIERLRGLVQQADRMMHQDAEVNLWVRQLKDIMYDADDVLDLCEAEGSKLLEGHPSTSSVRPPSNLFSCFICAKFRHEITNKIVIINNRLKETAESKSAVSKLESSSQNVPIQSVNLHGDSSFVGPEIVGTETEESVQRLVNSILLEDERKCAIFAIVGNPGIGKTTLARQVFNDERIIENFPVRVWASITQNFSPTQLLRNILKSAGISHEQAQTRAELENILPSALSKRFFLVLDDVWTSDVWEDLLKSSTERGSANGRILITSQSENTVKNMEARIQVKELDPADGWQLLCKNVFVDGEEERLDLKEIGVQIVEKCKGLPLAIKAIAGVLRSKEATRMEWTRVLESQLWSTSQLDKEVPSALYLSYEDLPSDLKQCFLYCSLYKAGCKIQRQDIIRYWLAEGFVKRRVRGPVEDVAEDYYKNLIKRNLLQPDPQSSDGSICIMHGLMHSLALSLMAKESICLGHGQGLSADPSVVIRRLSVNIMEDEAVGLNNLRQPEHLRTLFFHGSRQPQALVDNLIRKLRSIRVLDLSDTSIVTIPSSLGTLIHLRYLNLARTRITELPESIGNLRNLQSLVLVGCKSMHAIPQDITKLHRLRSLHLEETSLSHVPKGISRLKDLKDISGFVVGHNGDQHDGCGLEELQSLLELRGLEIHRLEKAATPASVLANKKFLRTLVLSSSATASSKGDLLSNEQMIRTSEKIYSELSPPPSLQRFTIQNFCGAGFPGWLMSSNLATSFPNLEELRLCDCQLCPVLPPLGQLPQLNKLFIVGAHGVVTIGPEFLHSSSRLATTVFPKLEFLHLERMDNLEEWSLVDEFDDEGAPVKLMPNLKDLFLDHCPKLKALPKGLHLLTSLQRLIIQDADSLKEVHNLPSVERLLVQNNSSLNRVSDLLALKRLKIDSCLALESVENIDAVEQLQLIYPVTKTTLQTSNIDANGMDENTERLPEWLPGVIKLQKRTLKTLYLTCDLPLLRQCAPQGKYWDLMFQIRELHAQTLDREIYLSINMVSHGAIDYQTNSELLLSQE